MSNPAASMTATTDHRDQVRNKHRKPKRQSDRSTADVFVIVVGSLPPPVAGQSLATIQLLESLSAASIPHNVVDIAEQVGAPSPVDSVRRAVFVASLPFRVAAKSRAAGGRSIVLYLQLAGSRSGIARDVLVLAVARAMKWRIVGHFHSRQWTRTIADCSPGLRRLGISAAHSCDKLAVLTQGAQREFEEAFDGSGPPLVVINNAVDADLEAAALSRPRSTGEQGPATVLFLANLIQGKGLPLLADIARESQRRGLAFRFVVAGDGDVRLLGSHPPDNVVVVGHVEGDAKLALLREADVLLLPTSLHEGEPLSVIEAYWFGLPVVATAIGGLRDLVGEANGRLVSDGDCSGFVDALVHVLEPENWSAISSANRARAKRDHSGSVQRDRLVSFIVEQ